MARGLGKWGAAAALFFAINALIVVLSLYQMTAEGTAKHALRRAVAALTEIDALIERDYDDLQQRAASVEADERVRLAEFPLDVSFAPREVEAASRDTLRSMLLDRSDDVLYDDGTDALRAADGADPGSFSAAGLVDGWLGFLRARNHAITGVLTLVMAAICVVLAGLLAGACRGFGRIAAVGATVLAGALPALSGAAILRLYIALASDADTEYTQRELLEIGEALAWIPLRNGIAFAALGATLLVAGTACAVLTDRRQAPRSFAGTV